MSEIAAIGSILTSVKTATDIAKLLKNSTVSLEQAETKLKLAELVGSLADAKLEIAEIRDLIMEKDKQIKKLIESQKLKGKMHWKDAVYYCKTEEGEFVGPFCPQCYDSENKVIRLQKVSQGHWRCMTCQNNFFDKDYQS